MIHINKDGNAGLAIATSFYDYVRMYEISNLGCVWST